MEGKTDDVPYDFMEYKAYIAKAIGADMKRIDGGLGNIIYRKDNVFSMN